MCLFFFSKKLIKIVSSTSSFSRQCYFRQHVNGMRISANSVIRLGWQRELAGANSPQFDGFCPDAACLTTGVRGACHAAEDTGREQGSAARVRLSTCVLWVSLGVSGAGQPRLRVIPWARSAQWTPGQAKVLLPAIWATTFALDSAAETLRGSPLPTWHPALLRGCLPVPIFMAVGSVGL